jgi:DNA-binding CsgD family transcriptional regulator
MDHLLIVAANQGVPEGFLQSLRMAGWRITLTADVLAAKQVLQKGDIAGVVIHLDEEHDPERLKILRFVHEFCPNTLVIMLHAVDGVAGNNLVHALDAVSSPQKSPLTSPSLDLYRLSPAQKRIAELVAQAYPNREIARKLRIKEQSVRNELSRIFKKMGVWNRVELALLMRTKEEAPSQAPRQPWKTDLPVPQTAENKVVVSV